MTHVLGRRRLDEARGNEAERECAADEGSRLPARELVNLVHDVIHVGLLQIGREAIDPFGCALDGASGAVMLLAQLLAR